MTSQMSDIKDILQYISDNNKLTIDLPYSKRSIDIKRYSIDSLNVINDIFDKDNNSEIAIEYLKYLFDIVTTRINEDLDYIDFLYTVFSLREKENSEYRDLNLTDILKDISTKSFDIEEINAEVVDGTITYKIELEYPTLQKLKDLISAAKTETKDIVFYNTFKFIKKIDIHVQDKRSSVSKPEDLYQLYNVLSYKALDNLSSYTSTINNNVSDIFQINIETDTGFLYNI